MTFSRVHQRQKTLKVDGQVLATSALSALDEKIRRCRKCRLWAGAMNAVPGEGPADAKVMLIGQNPGTEEDKTGRPFVGKSGKFLNTVLENNGILRFSRVERREFLFRFRPFHLRGHLTLEIFPASC
jgi:uracil-DNA glycosylase